MPLLHMETDSVRGVGNQLQQAAVSMQQQTQQLNNSVRNLANGWQGPSANIFVGEIQPLLQKLNQFARAGGTLNQRLQHEVDEWEQVASVLGVVDAAIIGGTLPLTGGGEVLGDSTSIPAVNYDNMSWKEKFAELERLDQQIAALEKELNGQIPVDGRINEIDDEITKLEEQLAEVQKRADAWYNQVIPTWPLQGDDDGVPWRVRTDNFEDEITGYEQRIQELHDERSNLVVIQNKQDQLAQLRLQQDELQKIVTEGIPADGPSSKHPYFPGTITNNCTKHASAKRYFPDAVNGHAYKWDDQAADAGYEVGNYPVKGSIMVFEPGIRKYHEEFGHVAFVEKVEPQPDGTYKVTFTDNNHPDPALCDKYKVAQPPKPSWPDYLIVTPGEKGISFIYDQKEV